MENIGDKLSFNSEQKALAEQVIFLAVGLGDFGKDYASIILERLRILSLSQFEEVNERFKEQSIHIEDFGAKLILLKEITRQINLQVNGRTLKGKTEISITTARENIKGVLSN